MLRVLDQTPRGAAPRLIELIGEFRQLPGLEAAQRNYLLEALRVNEQLLAGAPDDVQVIGNVIDHLLTIRNQVPGSVVRGIGGGHGEAGQSGILVELERALADGALNPQWDPTIVTAQCLHAMWRLLDYDPPPPATQDAFDTIVSRVLTHFLSLRMAYPETFAWLTERNTYLFAYLVAHRGTADMPLPRLTDRQLTGLQDEVHERR